MKNKVEKRFSCIILLVLISSLSIDSLSRKGINTNVDETSFSVSNLSTQDVFWPSNASEFTKPEGT